VHNAGYFTLAGPIFIMGLLFGFSGMPILERNANKRFRLNPDYLHYRTDTSVLVPLPNAIYRWLPLIVKRKYARVIVLITTFVNFVCIQASFSSSGTCMRRA
jgi:hypothetical protein